MSSKTHHTFGYAVPEGESIAVGKTRQWAGNARWQAGWSHFLCTQEAERAHFVSLKGEYKNLKEAILENFKTLQKEIEEGTRR